MEYFPSAPYKKVLAQFRAFLRKALERATLSPDAPTALWIAEGVHKYFDRYCQICLPQHKRKIECHAGCSRCCHHYPMSVEPFELIALYAQLRESPQMPELLEALLFRTRTFNQLLGAGQSDAEIEAALHRYFALGIPCVFLGEGGLCAVHAIRPLTCRMFFSLSDPQFCAAEHLETPRNQGLIVYLPEDIEEAMAEVSAQFEAWDLPESLYAGLEKMNSHENIFLNLPP